MSNKTGATGGASLSEYLSSSPYVSEVRVARSLIFCVVFCRSLFVDSFVLLILIIVFVCPSINDFWLPPLVSSKLFLHSGDNVFLLLTLYSPENCQLYIINSTPCCTCYERLKTHMLRTTKNCNEIICDWMCQNLPYIFCILAAISLWINLDCTCVFDMAILTCTCVVCIRLSLLLR